MQISANQIVLTNGLSEIGHGKALTMNKKIEEIAKQCWDERLDGKLHFDCEKFAELIIRECLGLYDSIDNGNLPHGTDNYFLAIERHFGTNK